MNFVLARLNIVLARPNTVLTRTNFILARPNVVLARPDLALTRTTTTSNPIIIGKAAKLKSVDFTTSAPAPTHDLHIQSVSPRACQKPPPFIPRLL
ncbi:uncharacterized protein PG986_015162 [Apiospora aurea]|uniref:Uncharacterized protein n=1 Tax=Apiospora aurea TaxID=335848 RepID=A0ABR1PRS5_9PEZI